MNFTPEQRLIVSLLCDIHQRLEIPNSYDSKLILDALQSHNDWAIQMKYGETLGVANPLDEEAVFVCKVLDMCEFLEVAYTNLPAQDQATVRELTRMNPEQVFAGFDGNNDSQLGSIAEFLVTKLHRFNYFQTRDFNAHGMPRDCYSRMLNAYNTAWAGRQLQPNDFTPVEIASILNERIHPTAR